MDLPAFEHLLRIGRIDIREESNVVLIKELDRVSGMIESKFGSEERDGKALISIFLD